MKIWIGEVGKIQGMWLNKKWVIYHEFLSGKKNEYKTKVCCSFWEKVNCVEFIDNTFVIEKLISNLALLVYRITRS